MKKLNVLSLFDGMSCGQLAISQLGFNYKYFASEIDKHAMQVTQANFPNTIQLGSVEHWQLWDVDFAGIDLLIGGSPCQGFSFAGKQLNFDDPRSKLFFVYVDILNYIRSVNPNVKFLLENVKMKKEYEAIISDHLAVKPIEINSNLVSAQNRKRLYWTNIEGITQPEDRGVYLKGILQEEVDEKYYLSDKGLSGMLAHKDRNADKGNGFGVQVISESDEKANTVLQRYYKDCKDNALCVAQSEHESACLSPKRTEYGKQIRKAYEAGLISERRKNLQQLEPRNDCKTNCLTSVQKDNLIIQRARGANKGGLFQDKCPTLTSNSFQHNNHVLKEFKIRRLTPIECERLQTVPDNYTASASDTQRYRMLGNGWTVEVIKHILKNLKA